MSAAVAIVQPLLSHAHMDAAIMHAQTHQQPPLEPPPLPEPPPQWRGVWDMQWYKGIKFHIVG